MATWDPRPPADGLACGLRLRPRRRGRAVSRTLRQVAGDAGASPGPRRPPRGRHGRSLRRGERARRRRALPRHRREQHRRRSARTRGRPADPPRRLPHPAQPGAAPRGPARRDRHPRHARGSRPRRPAVRRRRHRADGRDAALLPPRRRRPGPVQRQQGRRRLPDRRHPGRGRGEGAAAGQRAQRPVRAGCGGLAGDAGRRRRPAALRAPTEAPTPRPAPSRSALAATG